MWGMKRRCHNIISERHSWYYDIFFCITISSCAGMTVAGFFVGHFTVTSLGQNPVEQQLKHCQQQRDSIVWCIKTGKCDKTLALILGQLENRYCLIYLFPHYLLRTTFVFIAAVKCLPQLTLVSCQLSNLTSQL